VCEDSYAPFEEAKEAGSPAVSEALSRISALYSQLYRKEDLLDVEHDDDFVDPEMEPQEPWLNEKVGAATSTSLESDPNLPLLYGSEALKSKLRAIVLHYRTAFSNDLRPEPARVNPMKIEVDETLWHSPKNRGPYRPQSIDKQIETRKQIDKMLAAGVIEPSSAFEYRQILLVPKPNNKWRFCVDYRALNAATYSKPGWPIPNIPHLIQRLGAAKSDHFGVFDLTSGYYQAALHSNSRVLTAFICCVGLFQWLRMAIDLKGPPHYFQQQMILIVLAGLIYYIYEVYLDDIIVHGKGEDEFCHRTSLILQRAIDKNITFNPHKCRLGLDRVNYLSHHVIDSDGISVNNDKISKVVEFPTPTNSKAISCMEFPSTTVIWNSHQLLSVCGSLSND